MLRQDGPGLWSLGLASAFLVALHLLLTTMAWAGLFGVPVPSDLPVSKMWQSMVGTLAAASDGAAWKWQNFPWGFRGFDPMHGNLGYTASQAISLFLACYVLAFAEHKASRAWKATWMIVACFFSIAIANSRGAVLYSLLLLLLATGIYLLRFGRGKAVGDLFRGRSLHFAGALALLAIALVFFLGQSLSKDARWRTMFDKAYAGFLVADPVGFLCNGLSPQEHAALQQRISPQNPAYAEQIIMGLNGDGARIVLMRAGLQLVRENPLGLDGSRQAYEKLMVNKCGHRPVFEFAHAHQAWINLALSLG